MITKNICETFPALIEIDLYRIDLAEIKPDAFYACANLTILLLQQNRIKQIPSDAFGHLKNLELLQMSDNQLKELDSGLFANLPKLDHLDVSANNLTNFAPQLLQSNKALKHVALEANDLSDVAVEHLAEVLPNLKQLEFDNNEISCTRVVEITEFLLANQIHYNSMHQYTHKTRYYEQEILSLHKGLICNPDVSWMASNYRKQKSLTDQRFDKIEQKLSKIDQIEASLEKLIEMVDKLRK